MHSAESKQLHCSGKAVSVGVVEMLVPRLAQNLLDQLSRPLRVLAFQEVILREVSWTSSWQLQLPPLLPTKSTELLLSAVGEGGMAEEGKQEAAESAKRGMPSGSTKVSFKGGNLDFIYTLHESELRMTREN